MPDRISADAGRRGGHADRPGQRPAGWRPAARPENEVRQTRSQAPVRADHLGQRPDRRGVLDVDVEPHVRPGAEQVGQQRDRLGAVDPGRGHLRSQGSSAIAPGRVGHPVQGLVVEGHAPGRRRWRARRSPGRRSRARPRARRPARSSPGSGWRRRGARTPAAGDDQGIQASRAARDQYAGSVPGAGPVPGSVCGSDPDQVPASGRPTPGGGPRPARWPRPRPRSASRPCPPAGCRRPRSAAASSAAEQPRSSLPRARQMSPSSAASCSGTAPLASSTAITRRPGRPGRGHPGAGRRAAAPRAGSGRCRARSCGPRGARAWRCPRTATAGRRRTRPRSG